MAKKPYFSVRIVSDIDMSPEVAKWLRRSEDALNKHILNTASLTITSSRCFTLPTSHKSTAKKVSYDV